VRGAGAMGLPPVPPSLSSSSGMISVVCSPLPPGLECFAAIESTKDEREPIEPRLWTLPSMLPPVGPCHGGVRSSGRVMAVHARARVLPFVGAAAAVEPKSPAP